MLSGECRCRRRGCRARARTGRCRRRPEGLDPVADDAVQADRAARERRRSRRTSPDVGLVSTSTPSSRPTTAPARLAELPAPRSGAGRASQAVALARRPSGPCPSGSRAVVTDLTVITSSLCARSAGVRRSPRRRRARARAERSRAVGACPHCCGSEAACASQTGAPSTISDSGMYGCRGRARRARRSRGRPSRSARARAAAIAAHRAPRRRGSRSAPRTAASRS